MLALDDARTAIRVEMAAVRAELGAAADDAWSRPTRCTGWDVADLVAHLVWGQRLEAQGVEAVGTGRTTAREVPSVEPTRPAELLAQLDEAHAQLWRALAQRTADDLGTPAPMPYGPVPLGLLLQVITMEVGVHHSDLRAALDLPAHLGADVVAATAVFLGTFLPALAAAGTRPDAPVSYRLQGQVVDLTLSFDGDGWRVGDPGPGGVPAVVFSGADSDLCLFVLGRTALEPARITATGDMAAARRFSEYVPGP